MPSCIVVQMTQGIGWMRNVGLRWGIGASPFWICHPLVISQWLLPMDGM